MKKSVDLNAAYQPKSFEFRDMGKVAEIISRYPKGKQRSATMPLLDLAQRQVAEDGAVANPPYGGWIPRAAMDNLAREGWGGRKVDYRIPDNLLTKALYKSDEQGLASGQHYNFG